MANILIEAHALITGERKHAYGDPRRGFKNVADQWSLYLRQKYGIMAEITPEDVCWMMADLKKCRQMNAGKLDNVRDAAGYIGLIERVTDAES